MPKEQRSRKAYVQKHQPSYWSVWFGKNKKKNTNDDGNSSRVAQQGSMQGFVPQRQFGGHNGPSPGFQNQNGPGGFSFQPQQPAMGFQQQTPGGGAGSSRYSSMPRPMHPDEIIAHMHPGGNTEAQGRIPRGAGEPSAYSDRVPSGRPTSHGGGSPGHPWLPETAQFNAQQTRRRPT